MWIDTVLIPPTDRWPDWHLRIHRIRAHAPLTTLHTVEGGFAISGRRKMDGKPLPLFNLTEWQENSGLARSSSPPIDLTEGVYQTSESCLVTSAAEASGVCVLGSSPPSATSCSAMKPDANTNLMCQSTMIPVVMGNAKQLDSGNEFTLVIGIFAVSAAGAKKPRDDRKGKSILDRWLDVPVIHIPNKIKTPSPFGSSETDAITFL